MSTSEPEVEVTAPVEPGEVALFGLDDPDDAWLKRFRAADVAEPLGTLGAYVVIEEIAGGGQGVVYRARQPGTGRDVAIKRLRAGAFASADARQRFEREIAAAAGLHHANIVRVFGVEVVERQPLLVMEWVDGKTLHAWAAGAGPKERLAVFVKVCQAVHHAHQRGIIHRDLKPSNILVDAAGEPRVLDFGLARSTSEAIGEGDPNRDLLRLGTPEHRTQQFVGTLAYASPEQLFEPAAVDVRTDVYSLGVILYELLTGALPYSSDGSLADAVRVIGQPSIARPSSRCPAADRELDAIVFKALAHEADGRYASIEALGADVQRYLGGEPVLAHPRSGWYLIGKMVRRHRTAVALSAGIFVLAIAFGIVSTVLAARLADRQRTTLRAQHEEERARRVAQRVSDFLQSTLAAAGPAQSGPDTTLIDALHEAGRRAERELADEPEVAAEVHFTIGRTFRSLWMNEAVPHLRRAVELMRQVRGDRQAQVATCLSVLGTALANRRDPEAVTIQREALSIRRELYGDEHANVAESGMRLAYALFRTPPPRWDEAEQRFASALVLYRRLPGIAPRDLACCLHNYGYMRYKQSRTREALAMYREALALLRDAGGREDPYYVECLYGYGSLLAYVGLYKECIAALDEVTPLVRKSYGEARTHPLLQQRVAASLKLGDVAQAWSYAVTALEVRSRTLARESPGDAATLAAILPALRDVQGDGPPIDDLVATLAQLAPAAKVRVLDDVRLLADVAARCGQAERGAELLEALLPIARAAGDDARPDAAAILNTMAQCELERSNAAGAEGLWRDCIEMYEALDPPRRVLLAEARGGLGAALTLLGRYSEAEPLLTESYQALLAAHGDAYEQTRVPLERLIALYEACGRRDAAAGYRSTLSEHTLAQQSLAGG